jgi:D-alanyl-D-alanine dipeptidase
VVRGRKKETVRALVVLSIMVLAACSADERPPEDRNAVRTPELVEVVKLDPTIRLDIRYATKNNFLGRPVYSEARAFLQRPAAEALGRVQRALAAKGLGLVVFDGYRPWRVTKVFWDATPADKKEFVADPKKGSRHNRGCAVDLSLVVLATGELVAMPSEYDEMSERAHVDWKGGDAAAREQRDTLRAAMEAEGFKVFAPEWWHYDYQDWRAYPVLDLTFDEIVR